MHADVLALGLAEEPVAVALAAAVPEARAATIRHVVVPVHGVVAARAAVVGERARRCGRSSCFNHWYVVGSKKKCRLVSSMLHMAIIHTPITLEDHYKFKVKRVYLMKIFKSLKIGYNYVKIVTIEEIVSR